MSASRTSSAKKSRKSKRLNSRRGLASNDALKLLNMFQDKERVATDQTFLNFNIQDFEALGIVENDKGEASSEKITLYRLICKKGTSSMFYSKDNIDTRQQNTRAFGVDPDSETVRHHMGDNDKINNLIEFLQHQKQDKIDEAALECIELIEDWHKKNAIVERKRSALKKLRDLGEEKKLEDKQIEVFENLIKTADKQSKEQFKKILKKHDQNIQRIREKISLEEDKILKNFHVSAEELQEQIDIHDTQSPSKKRLGKYKATRTPPKNKLNFSEGSDDGVSEESENDNPQNDDDDNSNDSEDEDEDEQITKRKKRKAKYNNAKSPKRRSPNRSRV
jgi:hypothetical protein